MSVVLGIIRINALSVVARYVVFSPRIPPPLNAKPPFPSLLLFLYEDKVVAGWKKVGRSGGG